MAYIPFVSDKPVLADTGGEVVDDTRQNLMALRDAVVAGVMPGFTMAQTGANPERPDTITYTKATEQVRLTITWGTTGGAAGNPTVVAYDYSANSGGLWDAIGTLTMTYDANGNMTGSSWA